MPTVTLVIRIAFAPIAWTVEAVFAETDGHIERATFEGPCADLRARAYALAQYEVERPLVVAV